MKSPIDPVAATDIPLAQQMAGFIVGIRYECLPRDVIDHAKILTLDLLGAALSGVDTEEGRAIRAAADRFGPRSGRAGLWGTKRTSSPGVAALVNGTVAHAQEMDDFNGADHSGAVMVPALFAMLDAEGVVDGRRFIESMVAGYDVAWRLLDACGGYRSHNDRGWHSTGTCGAFGAAAAAARLLNLPERETSWAIGLGGTFCGGTWAFLADGAMSKRYHPGRAAEIGVTAAYMAASGFTGPTQVFEAPYGGFFATYQPGGCYPERLTADFGRPYRLLESGIKAYACCRGAHSTLDALLGLRAEHDLRADKIERVRVRCNAATARTLGEVQPRTRLAAQMSLPYSGAVALVNGQALLAEYEEPMFSDARVRALAGRFDMQVDPALASDAAPFISVETNDGRVLQAHVPIGRGDKRNPVRLADVQAKFDTLAARVLSAGQRRELHDAVMHIDEPGALQEVARALRVSGEAGRRQRANGGAKAAAAIDKERISP